MRKHSPRKWLHAVLDLLPVILIPVFMIYSHRHTMTQQTTVDIQYKFQSNDVNDVNDLVEGNIYYLPSMTFSLDTLNSIGECDIWIYSCSSVSNTFNFTLDEFDFTSGFAFYDTYLDIYIEDSPTMFFYSSFGDSYLTLATTFTSQTTLIFYDVIFKYFPNQNYFLSNFSLPEYTDFNAIESVQVNDESSSVTDVFVDNFTDTVNTKFNFAQMFNFNDIWSWLNTNLFNNISSPLAYAIYNIIIYEFLMDILFIIYALFMFIIDFCECLLEKPFDKVKRG